MNIELTGKNIPNEKIFDIFNKSNEIYVMGTSRDGYEHLVRKVFQINGYIDDYNYDTWKNGKPVKHRNQVDKKCIIIVCSTVRTYSACKSLINDGFKNVIDYPTFFNFFRDEHPFLTCRIIEEFEIEYKKNKEKYIALKNNLKDKKSRETIASIIEYRLTYDLNKMAGFKYKPELQYFSSVVSFEEHEVFADIGGYTGETSIEFISRCPHYKEIHFFEPDKKNIIEAKENLKKYKNIKLYQRGLSNKNESMCFDSGKGSASTLTETGNEVIEVNKLDDLITSEITFIKMDIEGAESAAIEGAKRHILENHPKLAIAVYHKPDDLWRIPNQILEIREDYDLYLRHYTEGTDETIMYFIPKITAD